MVASIMVGVGLIVMYAVVINGGSIHAENQTPQVVEHATSTERRASDQAVDHMSFDTFMEQVKSKEKQHPLQDGDEDAFFTAVKRMALDASNEELVQDKDTVPAHSASKEKLASEVDGLKQNADLVSQIAKATQTMAAKTEAFSNTVKPKNDKVKADEKEMLHAAHQQESVAKHEQGVIKQQKVDAIKTKLRKKMNKMVSASSSKLPLESQEPVHNPEPVSTEKHVETKHDLKHMLEMKPVLKKMKKKHSSVGHKLLKEAKKVVRNEAADRVHHVAHIDSSLLPPNTKPSSKMSKLEAHLHLAPRTHAQSKGEMPPAPAMKAGLTEVPAQCDEEQAKSKAACQLHLWEAVDACTSETLSPAEAQATPECAAGRSQSIKQCEEALKACAPDTYKADVQRLKKQVFKSIDASTMIEADIPIVKKEKQHPVQEAPTKVPAEKLLHAVEDTQQYNVEEAHSTKALDAVLHASVTNDYDEVVPSDKGTKAALMLVEEMNTDDNEDRLQEMSSDAAEEALNENDMNAGYNEDDADDEEQDYLSAFEKTSDREDAFNKAVLSLEAESEQHQDHRKSFDDVFATFSGSDYK